MAGAAEHFGQFAAAARGYRKALELDPNYLPARTELASLYSIQGETENALREQRRGVECDPRNPEAHAELARLCLEWRRHDEAIRALKRAVALSPRDAHLRLMLVHAYRRKGNLKQALQEIAALEKLKPNSPAVRQGRVVIERQMKPALSLPASGGRVEGQAQAGAGD